MGLANFNWRRNQRGNAITGETGGGILSRIGQYLGYLAILRELWSWSTKFASAPDLKAKIVVCLDALRSIAKRTATTLDDQLVAAIDDIVARGGLDLLIEIVDHLTPDSLQSEATVLALTNGTLDSPAIQQLRGRADRAGIDWRNLLRIAQWVASMFGQLGGTSIPSLPSPPQSVESPLVQSTEGPPPSDDES